jgi:hypothetical protein
MPFINHFMLGADPEFVFVKKNGDWMHARELGLRTGRAFGEDQNGRLVEVRAHPSRSAVEMVASVGDTLRWLATYVEPAQRLRWLAQPYVNEALGGHIHIGKLRENDRDDEVSALQTVYDNVAPLLWESENLQMRVEWGLAHNRMDAYGRGRDIRKQPHGYEYRTWPTWLDSPWLAHFVATVSKLAAARPKKVLELAATPQDFTERLLTHFAALDEDAALALQSLERHSGALPRARRRPYDFRDNWGIPVEPAWTYKIPQRMLIPPAIEPKPWSVEAVRHAVLQRAPVPVPAVDVWTPSWEAEIPENYMSVLDYLQEPQKWKGLGEETWDLCAHTALCPRFDGRPDEGDELTIKGLLAEHIVDADVVGLRKAGLKVSVVARAGSEISLGEELREPNNYARTRAILKSGVFPLWTTETLKTEPEAFEKWMAARTKVRGREVYDSTKARAPIDAWGNRVLYDQQLNAQIPQNMFQMPALRIDGLPEAPPMRIPPPPAGRMIAIYDPELGRVVAVPRGEYEGRMRRAREYNAAQERARQQRGF